MTGTDDLCTCFCMGIGVAVLGGHSYTKSLKSKAHFSHVNIYPSLTTVYLSCSFFQDSSYMNESPF